MQPSLSTYNLSSPIYGDSPTDSGLRVRADLGRQDYVGAAHAASIFEDSDLTGFAPWLTEYATGWPSTGSNRNRFGLAAMFPKAGEEFSGNAV